VILEYMFYRNPAGSQVNKEEKTFTFLSSGDSICIYTCVKDLATYTIQAISAPDALNEGVYHVESFRCSNREMTDAYSEVRGTTYELKTFGSLELISKMLDETRATVPKARFMEYNGLSFGKQLLLNTLFFDAVDCQKWPQVKQTGLVEWLKANPKA
jgi:hypothetical protein